jgi:hypothetical protein
MLGPRKVALCHHDNWTPPLTSPTDIQLVKLELARGAKGVEFIECPVAVHIESAAYALYHSSDTDQMDESTSKVPRLARSAV